MGQTDQDFNSLNDAYYHLDDALTEAYHLEVNEGKVKASSENFKETEQVTWLSGAVTFSFPTFIQPHNILELYDVSDDGLGRLLILGRRSSGQTIFWKRRDLLQWGSEGPTSDVTLEVTYVAIAQTLKTPLQEPELIPYEFRDLLTWSAACILAAKAEQKPPYEWKEKRDEWRSSWYTAMSRGRPMHQNVPRIRNHRRR